MVLKYRLLVLTLLPNPMFIKQTFCDLQTEVMKWIIKLQQQKTLKGISQPLAPDITIPFIRVPVILE